MGAVVAVIVIVIILDSQNQHSEAKLVGRTVYCEEL